MVLSRYWMVAAALCVLGSGEFLSAEQPQNRPNVVLLMCDDLGYGDLTCFNPESSIKTPHLCEMAAAGLKFTRFYAAAPVCSPTRGSCLTGRHPHRYGIYYANTGHMLPEEITLPELLRESGYTTGHFGKWHLGTLTTEVQDANRGGPKNPQHFAPPQDHGYDVCFVTESKVPTYDPMIAPKGANKTSWDPVRKGDPTVSYGTRYWNEKGEEVTENLSGDDSRVMMDRAIPFIQQAVEDEQPFLATIWFHAPHLPVVADRKYGEIYPGLKNHPRNYYGCISAVDEQVGRLRAKLRELGVAENTMVWFCSDNGPEGNDKSPGLAGGLKGRKRSLYEGGVRVPGILEWPAVVPAGTETDVPAVTSDYLPTILEVLERPLPGDRPYDGISLLPVIRGEVAVRDAPIGFQSRKQIAWTGDHYKLYSGDSGKTWELYDLIQDPEERTNLAAEEPEIVQQMQEAALQWVASCEAE